MAISNGGIVVARSSRCTLADQMGSMAHGSALPISNSLEVSDLIHGGNEPVMQFGPAWTIVYSVSINLNWGAVNGEIGSCQNAQLTLAWLST
jgi:hypothetical protein